MEMEYLNYLECVLKSLSNNFERGLNIDEIMSFYNKNSDQKITRSDQKHFEELYENVYIHRTGTSRKYRILPDIKSIIDKYGSLSARIEFIEKERLKKESEESEFKRLQLKNLNLQNENLEFSQTIREQEAKIRNLELKIKGIELLKQYWWFILLCIFLGGFLKEPLDILLTYIRQLLQSTQILHG